MRLDRMATEEEQAQFEGLPLSWSISTSLFPFSILHDPSVNQVCIGPAANQKLLLHALILQAFYNNRKLTIDFT